MDEDSIKVEGTGTAIISDIAVELLPNRDIFEEIYPESEIDESDEEPEPDCGGFKQVSPALSTIRDKITLLDDEKKWIEEAIASADSRLKILDQFTKSANHENKVDIKAELATYRDERENVFQDHMDNAVRARDIDKERDQLKTEEAKLRIAEAKEDERKAKAQHKKVLAKAKENLKKQRRKEDIRKERLRIRQERERFWPRQCWSVRITLDAMNASNPGSSRHSSITSASDLVNVEPEKENSDTATYNCDLSLSYVVSNAWWTPSYDLSLSTTTNTATLCFDAQLTNRTSENWTNCKIILSTSQATFAGLQDAIPTLVPWRVRLGGKHGVFNTNAIMQSREEASYKGTHQTQQQAWYAEKTRQHLYGLDETALDMQRAFQGYTAPGARGTDHPLQAYQSSFAQLGQQNRMRLPQRAQHQPMSQTGAQPTAHQPQNASSIFGPVTGRAEDAAMPTNVRAGSGLFGSNSAIPPPPSGASRIGAVSGPQDLAFRSSELREEMDHDDETATLSATTLPPPLDFQDSSFQETGLTTTYDLPGSSKSLLTTSTNTKQRVARVSFISVTFSHTIVAKYKPVAYLKTKLHNASKLTLLKGPVGLTLDGTFMGRSTLPRCSPGDYVTLSLGIDPAILVSYPKPDVKRSTTGVFSKEDSSVYTRSISVTNTRSQVNKPINLVVLDQVPVSEDERLRIVIVTPRGLQLGGGSVPVGKGIVAGGKEGDWGRAGARLKMGGEVVWDVSLNAGKGVKLVLEYEVGVPGGDTVIQC